MQGAGAAYALAPLLEKICSAIWRAFLLNLSPVGAVLLPYSSYGGHVFHVGDVFCPYVWHECRH